MDSKQFKFYSKLFHKSALDNTISFLNENKFTLFNLAYLGDGDWRVMYHNKDGKVESRIFEWGEIEIDKK